MPVPPTHSFAIVRSGNASVVEQKMRSGGFQG
jgi:hypothetical protein